MLQQNVFSEIKQAMIANEQQLLIQNSLTDKSKPISVDEVYDDIDQMKRFPSTNSSCVELCKFVSKLSIAINMFNADFEKYANNMVHSNGAGKDMEEVLKIKASERLDELKKTYSDYTKDLSEDEKLITRQIYCDLIATKVREYPTISMRSPDGQYGIAGGVKPEITKIVANLQSQMKDARIANPNSWFVNEMYDYLFNSSNINGHAKASLEQLRNKSHELETQVESEFRSTTDNTYVINDVQYSFKDEYVALAFFNSRQEYYSKIAGNNNEIYGGLNINRAQTQFQKEKNLDTYQVIKLEDNSYKTFIGSQVYCSYRAYKINEAIKVRKLNNEMANSY